MPTGSFVARSIPTKATTDARNSLQTIFVVRRPLVCERARSFRRRIRNPADDLGIDQSGPSP